MRGIWRLLRKLFVLTVLGMLVWWTMPAPAPVTPQSLPTLQAIRELSELVMLQVEVADVCQTRIDGHLGGIAAIVVVRGDYQIAVDLNLARLTEVDHRSRSAMLVLPEPTASRPRIDHSRSELFAVRQDGLWAITPGDRAFLKVTDLAWRAAQARLANSGTDASQLAFVRRRVETAVQQYARMIGWTIKVQWPGRPMGRPVAAFI